MLKKFSKLFILSGILCISILGCSSEEVHWENTVEGEYWNLEYTIPKKEYCNYTIQLDFVNNFPNDKIGSMTLDYDFKEPILSLSKSSAAWHHPKVNERIEKEANLLCDGEDRSVEDTPLEEVKELLSESKVKIKWKTEDKELEEVLYFN